MFLQEPYKQNTKIEITPRRDVNRLYQFMELMTVEDHMEMETIFEKIKPVIDTSEGPMIDGKPFSIAEWVSDRCKKRLNELSNEERNKFFNDSVCDKTYFTGHEPEPEGW